LRALWSFRTFRTLRAWRAWRATRRLVRQAIPRRRAIADLVLERVSLVAGFARQQRRVCRSPERSDSIAPLHRNGDRGHGVPPLMSVTMMLGSITPELHGNVWYSNPLTGSLKTPSMLKYWFRYKMRM